MRYFTSTLLAIFIIGFSANAQYTTPDTGVNWTLDDIATGSPGTVSVSGNVYTLHEDLTVAETDTLHIDTDLTLEIEEDVLVTVFGTFIVDAEDITITAVDEAAPYEGFRLEEFSEVVIENAIIEYGGGLRVLTEDFTLNNTVLQYNVEGVSTGGVVSMSRGMPQITNNTFLFNETPALSSGGNTSVSAFIYNNYIEGNNQANANRPQINMGTTMTSDTLKIIQNTIIGDETLDQVGGIGVSNLLGSGDIVAIIDDNTVQDNRFGITVMGANSFAYIRNNVVEDNATQGDPMLGGSGINLNAPNTTMEIVASGNEIRRNLWGITLQGESSINIGDDEDNPGGNIFAENENNGDVHALFNNTANTISAMYNCWVEDGEGTLEEAEEVITHQEDDANLGEVIFDPIECETLNVSETEAKNIALYPNPATNYVSFQNDSNFEKVRFFDRNGKLLFEKVLSNGANTIEFQLPTGIYFATFSNNNTTASKKILVK